MSVGSQSVHSFLLWCNPPHSSGKSKSLFYSGDNTELEYDSNDEQAQLEEEAALMQQKKRLELLDEADFQLGGDNLGTAKPRTKGEQSAGSSDALLLSAMNHDLDDISLNTDAVEVEQLVKKTAHLSAEDRIRKVLTGESGMDDLAHPHDS